MKPLPASAVMDLRVVDPTPEPFRFVQKDDFLAAEVFAGIARGFPECQPSTGPTGHSLYWGDPAYDRLVAENAAWKAFFKAAHSQEFVDYCVRQFANEYAEQGCTLDLGRAAYVPYQESRDDKERRHIARVVHAPHELFVRLDIHQGHVGYRRKVHLDHRRRLVSMLVYFSDSQETFMEGGELVLHGRVLGFLHPERARVAPRGNRMACFACSPRSRHSVPEIRSQKGPRNYVQIQVSSSVDAWSA